MEVRTNQERVCPICGRSYKERPAISRADNVTAICPTCGTKEALKSLGVSDDEINEIISKIPTKVE